MNNPFAQLGRKAQQGLTLVEIMVSMAVGLFVLAAILFVYSGNRVAFKHGENLSQIQEGGRIAVDVMANDIRMAAFMGCMKSSAVLPILDAGNPSTEQLNQGLIGNTYLSGAPSFVDDGAMKGVEGTDVFEVLGAGGETSQSTEILKTVKDTIKVSSAFGLGKTVKAGDAVVITDCQVGDLFTVKSVSTSGGIVSIKPSKALSKTYGKDATVLAYTPKRYYLRDTGRTNLTGNKVLSLFQWSIATDPDAAELVEGVEDMRVCYAEGVDVVDGGYKTATDVVAWDQVLSVRVDLLTVSVENNAAVEPQKYYFDVNKDCVIDRTVGGPDEVIPTDKKMRQVFTTTVALRNKLK